MRRIVAGIALGLCVLCPRPAFAWGEVGHRVVGRIAASQLTQAARARVAKILGVANTKAAVADALSDAAEWPDAVARTKYKKTVDWHFIDLGVKPNASKDNTLWASSDTAFARIIKYAGTIKARMPDTGAGQRFGVRRPPRRRHPSTVARHDRPGSWWQLLVRQFRP